MAEYKNQRFCDTNGVWREIQKISFGLGGIASSNQRRDVSVGIY